MKLMRQITETYIEIQGTYPCFFCRGTGVKENDDRN